MEEFFNILRIIWLTQSLDQPNLLCVGLDHFSFDLYNFYWVLITFKIWYWKNWIRHNSSTRWDYWKIVWKIKNPTSTELTVKVSTIYNYGKGVKKALTFPKKCLNSLYNTDCLFHSVSEIELYFWFKTSMG